MNVVPSLPDEGVEQELERLLESYAPLLRSLITRHCPRNLGIQIAEIEQEARLRLWRALEREKELADPESYIYRVAVTTTIDAVRRVRSRREDQLHMHEHDDERGFARREFAVDPIHSPDLIAERRELMAKICSALETLAENRRRAVELHLQGLTLAEIADLLDWTEPKARNLVYRGLDDLRDALRRKGIDWQ